MAILFHHAHSGSGRYDNASQILAIVVLLLGAFSFTCGSVLSRRSNLTLYPLVCAGWEMLAASACDLTTSTVFRQWSHAHWTHTAIAAIGYLILFGSLGGFTAYIWLLSQVPVAKLATYAYVNPIVAVLIGAVVLGERLRNYEYVGMAVTLFAVFVVTSSQMASQKSAVQPGSTPIAADV
jgi:drug/metabolite transporter (DMT)-like permease